MSIWYMLSCRAPARRGDSRGWLVLQNAPRLSTMSLCDQSLKLNASDVFRKPANHVISSTECEINYLCSRYGGSPYQLQLTLLSPVRGDRLRARQYTSPLELSILAGTGSSRSEVYIGWSNIVRLQWRNLHSRTCQCSLLTRPAIVI